MQDLGAILGPAEKCPCVIASSLYLVPINPGFICLPYSRFAAKECCHSLAMVQINLNEFIFLGQLPVFRSCYDGF
jgi:hypothetical protein